MLDETFVPEFDGMRLANRVMGHLVCEGRRSLAKALFACAILFVMPAHAQPLETNWNAATGSWFEVGNWTAGVPNLASEARVDNAGTSQIMFPGAETYIVHVGAVASGELQIGNGGSLSNWYGLIGTQSGSTGAVTVTGSGSLWTNSVDLYVGDYGAGELTIADGGAVSDVIGWIGFWPGSEGTVSVVGEGSNWINSAELVVGREGAATLMITAGGAVSAASVGRIGVNPGADGAVTVSGDGSNLSSGALYVGQYGRGELTIANGGVVTNVDGRITGGEFSGSTPPGSGKVTVTGNGSAWINSSSLLVAEFGTGELTIADGGMVTSTFGHVASSADGTVMVTGSGSAWANSNELQIGRHAAATVRIADGGMVSNGSVDLAAFSDADATVTVTGSGSQWNTSGDMFVGGRVFGPGGSASVTIADGAHLGVTGTVKLWNGGTVTIDGGSLTAASLDRTVGTLQHNDGTLTIDGGTYTRPAGTLAIDGATPAAHASLVLANGATATGVTGVTVGDTRRGSLTISGGSNIANSGLGRLGGIAGSHGDATVSGAFSTWTNAGSLTVGSQGIGELTIADGGGVTNTIGIVGSSLGSTGTVMVTGTSSIWTNSSGLTVGSSGAGSVTIADGGSVSSGSGSVGSYTGSNGSVTITGDGSTWTTTGWTNSGSLSVGEWGNGTLDITDGALVDVYGDTFVGRFNDGGRINLDDGTLRTRSLLAAANRLDGTGTVDAHGLVTDTDLVFDAAHGQQQQVILAAEPDQNITINLDVNGSGVIGTGYRAEGSLTIADGQVVAGREGYLAYRAGSAATAIVDGIGSNWTSSGALRIAFGGSAELTIANGAAVSSAFGTIGQEFTAEGIVTVTEDGSTWSNSGGLGVGVVGKGKLTITAGGSVTSNGGTIGSAGSGSGMVTVTGSGSSWTNSSSLSVGIKGVGKMTIANGGVVSNTTANIDSFASRESSVIVTGSGSHWTTSGMLTIGRTTEPRTPGATTGRLTVAGGGVVTAAVTDIRKTGMLLGDGTIVADVNNAGAVAPGAPLGIVHVTGDYTQSSTGKLLIDLASATDYDTLAVTDAATLGGVLQVSLLGDYVPTPGQQFEVLTADSVTNNGLTLAAPATALFELVVSGSSVTLQAIGSGLAGDFNGDSAVDAADYVVLRKGMGTLFNEAHYGIWRTNFGATIGSASTAMPAPELSSFALACCAMAFAVAASRRSRSLPKSVFPRVRLLHASESA